MTAVITSFNDCPLLIGQSILGFLVLVIHVLCDTSKQAALVVIFSCPLSDMRHCRFIRHTQIHKSFAVDWWCDVQYRQVLLSPKEPLNSN